jgi:hypothetical protein
VNASIVAMERKAGIETLDESDMKVVQAAQERGAAKTMTTPATATILSVRETGVVGKFTQMEWQLKVTPRSGLPEFELPYKVVASDRVKGLAVPGASFDADYDPANQTDIDIHI